MCRDRNSPGGELERVKDPVNLPSDPLSSSSRQLKVIQLLNQTRNDRQFSRKNSACCKDTRQEVERWAIPERSQAAATLRCLCCQKAVATRTSEACFSGAPDFP